MSSSLEIPAAARAVQRTSHRMDRADRSSGFWHRRLATHVPLLSHSHTPCPPGLPTRHCPAAASAGRCSTRRSLLYASVGTGILVFTRDMETGALCRTHALDSDAPAGSMAVDPDCRFLYAALGGPSGGNLPGAVGGPAVSSFRLGAGGELQPLGTHALADGSQFISTDHTGRYLFSSHFSRWDGEPGGGVALHRINADGVVDHTVCRHRTAFGAHSIWAEPSTNAAVFSPATGPAAGEELSNGIFQSQCDARAGTLLSHPSQPRVAGHEGQGPRHLCWGTAPAAPPMAYSSDEQGCSVTAYTFDAAGGTLAAVQTVSTGGLGHHPARGLELLADSHPPERELSVCPNPRPRHDRFL